MEILAAKRHKRHKRGFNHEGLEGLEGQEGKRGEGGRRFGVACADPGQRPGLNRWRHAFRLRFAMPRQVGVRFI